jgi:predicted MFS family arabinose efflux permease
MITSIEDEVGQNLPAQAVITRRLTLLMAASCGLSVATMYYSQPLLADMGATVAGGAKSAAYIPTFTQVGTMLGMGLFVPLGDMFERRGLIVSVCLALAFTSLATALAPNFALLAVASFFLGLTCIVPHLILPFAAQISPPESRGKTLGTVVSGLLIGILCARTFSGFVGAAFGWRSVYFVGAGLMVVLAVVLRRYLPVSHPSLGLSYPKLLRSMVHLIRTFPQLREAAATGALLFAAFSAFWATLIFRLGTPPFHYGSRAAGLFGLVGAAGAAAAPLVGRMADTRGPRKTVELSLFVTAASFFVFWFAGSTMAGLILGVVLMDLGVQAGHVANQTRIYGILPEARSRLNTVYMVTYFLGGAIGSALGAYGWNAARWTGVCIVGLVLMGMALAVQYISGRREFA